MSINIIHDINFAAQSITDQTFHQFDAPIQSLYESVINHGCWCARMNPDNDKAILGGPHPQDELDEICKQWYSCRYCNDALSGGSCHASENAALVSYDILWNSSEQQYRCQASGDACGNDSCSVDVYYSNLIVQYIKEEFMTFSPIIVADRAVCHPDTTNQGTVAASGYGSQVGSGESNNDEATQATCQGTAPHFEIVRAASNNVVETSTIPHVPVKFEGVYPANPVTTYSFRMSFDIKLLARKIFLPGLVLRLTKVGDTKAKHSSPILLFEPSSFRLIVESYACIDPADYEYYDVIDPSLSTTTTSNEIGQIGDTVHVVIELYNQQLKIAYGDEVEVTNNWNSFCVGPTRVWETKFEAGDGRDLSALAEVYDYTFEPDITGFTL